MFVTWNEKKRIFAESLLHGTCANSKPGSKLGHATAEADDDLSGLSPVSQIHIHKFSLSRKNLSPLAWMNS